MSAFPIRNFTILQGATLSLPFYWYDGPSAVKAVSGVTLGYPPVITATAHGLPTNEIPVRLFSLGGTVELNTVDDDPVYALKIDANTFSLPDIDAAGFTPYTSGGYVVYKPPKDLTSYTARMQLRSSVGDPAVLFECTDSNGRLVLGGTEGLITLVISASDTATLNFDTAVYQLELVSGGVVTRLVGGTITLDKEVTI